jgi:hypothetical protein
MVQRSKEMVKELQAIGVGDRPIVWVGHSKGGLFVKQMLVDGEIFQYFLSHTFFCSAPIYLDFSGSVHNDIMNQVNQRYKKSEKLAIKCSSEFCDQIVAHQK